MLLRANLLRFFRHRWFLFGLGRPRLFPTSRRQWPLRSYLFRALRLSLFTPVGSWWRRVLIRTSLFGLLIRVVAWLLATGWRNLLALLSCALALLPVFSVAAVLGIFLS
jgi:hypothetical protein